MNSEVKQIIDMATTSHAEPKKYVCKDCQNTGLLEIIEYYGKEVMPGFPKAGQTVVGFNLFFKMCYIWWQKNIPELPRMDMFEINPDTIKAMEKVKGIYNPYLYYRLKGYDRCNGCKSYEFRYRQ
jgi:hypothetical protein